MRTSPATRCATTSFNSREPVEQHLVKRRRILYLRGVAEFGELHQFGPRYAHRGALGQLRIIAQRRANVRGREVLADGGIVLVADDEQGGHGNVLALIEHVVRKNHVVEQWRSPSHPFLALPAV